MTQTTDTVITNRDDNKIELTLLSAYYVPGTIMRIPNVFINFIFIKLSEFSTIITCILKMSHQRGTDKLKYK